VVLPNPAGAEMRVSGRVNPSAKRAIRRERGTSVGRAGGR